MNFYVNMCKHHTCGTNFNTMHINTNMKNMYDHIYDATQAAAHLQSRKERDRHQISEGGDWISEGGYWISEERDENRVGKLDQ